MSPRTPILPGIEFYDDLNTPVNRTEAEIIRDLVVEETDKLLPGATVTITGGFIRYVTEIFFPNVWMTNHLIMVSSKSPSHIFMDVLEYIGFCYMSSLGRKNLIFAFGP